MASTGTQRITMMYCVHRPGRGQLTVLYRPLGNVQPMSAKYDPVKNLVRASQRGAGANLQVVKIYPKGEAAKVRLTAMVNGRARLSGSHMSVRMPIERGTSVAPQRPAKNLQTTKAGKDCETDAPSVKRAKRGVAMKRMICLPKDSERGAARTCPKP